MKWNEVQRFMAQYPERWIAIGTDIYSDTPSDPATLNTNRAEREWRGPSKPRARQYLGCVTSAPLATLVVMIHNTYLTLARETVMLRRRMADMERMRER